MSIGPEVHCTLQASGHKYTYRQTDCFLMQESNPLQFCSPSLNYESELFLAGDINTKY